MMLSGFRSRCTTPRAWAYAIAWVARCSVPTSRRSSTVHCSAGAAWAAAMDVVNVRPFTSFIV